MSNVFCLQLWLSSFFFFNNLPLSSSLCRVKHLICKRHLVLLQLCCWTIEEIMNSGGCVVFHSNIFHVGNKNNRKHRMSACGWQAVRILYFLAMLSFSSVNCSDSRSCQQSSDEPPCFSDYLMSWSSQGSAVSLRGGVRRGRSFLSHDPMWDSMK